jgi:broad specificity phosphatase PhoE
MEQNRRTAGAWGPVATMPVLKLKHNDVVLVRHGKTAWSKLSRHTGATDLPQTPEGEEQARALAPVLGSLPFQRVLASPLQRAQRTCALAGFGERMEMDADVVEWNYGVYEGLTRAEIQSRTPGWMMFRHGCPQGESAEEVGARADRVIARLTGGEGPTLLDTATLNVLSSTKTHRPWPVGMWPSPETPPRERWTARTGSGSFTRRSPSR